MAWLLHRSPRVPNCTRSQGEFERVRLDCWWCNSWKLVVVVGMKLTDEEIEFERLMYEALARTVAEIDRHLAGRLSILVDDGDGGDRGKPGTGCSISFPWLDPQQYYTPLDAESLEPCPYSAEIKVQAY